MGREMVKLSWATKTFVPLQFYNLVSLLLQCLISLFARSLDCLFVFFLFVLFFLPSSGFDWPAGWQTDWPTYFLAGFPSSFFISYLPTPSFFLRPRTSLPTHQHIYPFAEVLAPSMCSLIATPTCHLHLYIFIHLHSHSCLSFHHILFSSIPCFLVTLYARYLRRSTTNMPSALGCLKKK